MNKTNRMTMLKFSQLRSSSPKPPFQVLEPIITLQLKSCKVSTQMLCNTDTHTDTDTHTHTHPHPHTHTHTHKHRHASCQVNKHSHRHSPEAVTVESPRPAPPPPPAPAAEAPACSRPGASSLSAAGGRSPTGLNRLGDRPWLDRPGGE